MSKAKQAEDINMAKYNDSMGIVAQCEGCDKVFEHIQVLEEGEFPLQMDKCRAYTNPASKWPAEGQEFAMRTVSVVERSASGRIKSREVKEAPVLEKYCPLATHFAPIEKTVQGRKVLVGQQKQGR